MKIQLEKQALQTWLNQRTLRESMLLFLVGLFLIYSTWNLIFERTLQRQRANLRQQNEELLRLLQVQQHSLSTVQKVIASPSFTHALEKQTELREQFQQAGEQEKRLEQTFVPVGALSQVTNDIIAQQAEVILVSMKMFPEEPWLQAKNTPNNEFPELEGIYKYKMELEFRGSYFNVMAFLNHLEKLPWHLYWDHLDYQVLNYPEAKVVARFYVLSNEKG